MWFSSIRRQQVKPAFGSQLSSQPLSALCCVLSVEKEVRTSLVVWSLQLHEYILCTPALNDVCGLHRTARGEENQGQIWSFPNFSNHNDQDKPHFFPLLSCTQPVPCPLWPFASLCELWRPGCLTKILLCMAFRRSASMGWGCLHHSFLFAFILLPLLACQTLRKALEGHRMGQLWPQRNLSSMFLSVQIPDLAGCCCKVSDSIGWWLTAATLHEAEWGWCLSISHPKELLWQLQKAPTVWLCSE